MESDKEEAKLANTETITSPAYEDSNKLEEEESSDNNALQKELNIVTIENTSKNNIEFKQSAVNLSNTPSPNKMNNTINIKESTYNTQNSEIQIKDDNSDKNPRNKDSNSEENSIPISVTAKVDALSENNTITLNTNVVTINDKEDIELALNENVPNDSLKVMPNRINEVNVNISDKENDILIESKHKCINRKNSVNDNLEMSCIERNGPEKQAVIDLINEIDSNESLHSDKNTEHSNMTQKASNNNNNKDNDDRNSVRIDNNVQLSKSEDSAETANSEAVEIKCEVDCNALLDDIKDEIIDEENYNVSDFMDLANHFLTNEARVVLQRIVVYKCPQCPRVFTSSGQRSMHKAKHVSEQVLSNLRHKENTSERFIKRHQCPECDQRFVQESTLKTHMVIHQPYPNICQCGIGYTKLNDLKQHERLVHNKIESKSSYTSTWRPIINLKKTKRSEINRKRLKKEPEIRQPTPEPTTSRYGRKQKRYVDLRDSNIQLEYSSDDLDDETVFQPKKKKAKPKFKTPEQIVAEEERLIKKENKELQKAQNKERRLAIKQENANKGPFICTICDRELKTYQTYEVHLQSHANLRNFKCEICEKAFNSATGLRNHQLTHLENQFKCSFCDKTFNTNHNKNNHENIHMGVKPYVCGYCDKSFSDQSAFKRHERIHTGVKPYKCEYCPKAFSDASAAIVHRRRHKGERKFACRLCDKTFHYKGARDLHETLHGNEYIFECDLCSSKFQLKQYLVSHMKRKHGDRRKVKCSMCDAKMLKPNMNTHMLGVHGVKRKKKEAFKVFNGPVEIEVDLKKELLSES